MRKLSELDPVMLEKYTGNTAVVNKGGGDRTYIPWTSMARELDVVFGWDGWSTRNIPGSTVYDQEHQSWVTAVDLEITFYDDTIGQVRTIVRAGMGGERVKANSASEDAAKSGRSDAFVVAARNLGDRFGLYLTPERGSAPAASGNGHAQQQAGSDEGPSDAQLGLLRKCKVPEDLIRSATRDQAGTFFNCIFPDKKTGEFKFGRKYTNDEALIKAFGQEAVNAEVGSD